MHDLKPSLRPREVSYIGFMVLLGFALAFLTLVYALSILAKLLCVTIVPGVVYVPVRLLMGASPVPRTGSPAHRMLEAKSRLHLAFMVLFLAMLQGYGVVLYALFIFGCVVTPLGIVDSVFRTQLLSAIPLEVMWPLIGAAFTGGVALAAVRDVQDERNATH